MKHPWRRIGAYGIDYLVILVWMAVLFGAAQFAPLRLNVPDVWTTATRWSLQGQGFLLMTLPVWLYFTLCESFGRQATLGKRIAGLQVQPHPGSVTRIALRNALKFAPWELAHTGIWHGMPIPLASEPDGLGWTIFVLSLGLSGLYLVSLFIGNGRTLYDRLAGSWVGIAQPRNVHVCKPDMNTNLRDASKDDS